jgi:hypothetical protein
MVMLTDRIIGVLRLDVNTFEEVEADESATMQAVIIVAAVAILSAIGAFIGARAGNAAIDALDQLGDVNLPFAVPTLSPMAAALNAIIGAFVAWLLWSALTYFIGTKLFEGEATMGEMLRVIGFAQAPLLLRVLSFIPCLGAIISLVATIWSLVTGFIGIRQGLDLDNVKTLITIVASWLVAVIINLIVIGPVLGLIGL